MDTQQPDGHDGTKVGIRPRDQVEKAYDALERLAAQPARQTQISRGALTGYLWALGRGDVAPVTGAPGRVAPDLKLLTAEADAAVIQLENATQRTVPRDYIQGVHDALAWVCGHTERRP